MTGRADEMSTEECWELLGRLELGRLAYQLDGRVHIAPVNYAVDPTTGRRRLVFRTAEGSKLRGVLRHPRCAFEVDEVSGAVAQSVVVEGVARELTGDEALMVDQLRLRPWSAGAKEHVLAIEVESLSGRFFHLSKPWEHLLHDWLPVGVSPGLAAGLAAARERR